MLITQTYGAQLINEETDFINRVAYALIHKFTAFLTLAHASAPLMFNFVSFEKKPIFWSGLVHFRSGQVHFTRSLSDRASRLKC